MNEKALREHLVSSLSGKGAHISFDRAVEGFPVKLLGARVPSLAHTAWQLGYHVWLCQWDILEFIRDPGYRSPSYPSGYWPKEDGPSGEREWTEIVGKFRADLKTLIAMVRDAKSDLFEPFPHGEGQNLLREALTVIDHNSYHIGQFVDIRMLLGVPVKDW